MKDNVENRKRISLRRKLKVARIALKENGVFWCLMLAAYYASSTLADRAYSVMDRLRRTRDIPGLNSLSLNKEIWEAWDWSAGGEEWSASESSKQSLIRAVLDVEVPRNSSILEIGPGGGRWTAALLDRACDYVGIDISAACVEHCRKRFGSHSHASFLLGSGSDLAPIPNGAIDAIWSVDVFVHINRAEVAAYAKEFRRVLRAGGVGVIHHGAVGGSRGGWRSNLTRADFEAILGENGFLITKSIDQWSDGELVNPLSYGDLMTVFAAPGKPSPLPA
jgi:SAM-dependent methyltransferase